MASSLASAALAKGSLLLVTGANGACFVGSHAVNEALKLGYRVRGVVRDASKLSVLKKRWDDEFPGRFEVAVVEESEKEGAYDEAMKGVSGVAHISPRSGGRSLSAASLSTSNQILTCLRSAARSPSVQRFVLTSTTAAAHAETPEVEFTAGQESWNEEVVGQAEKEEGPMKGLYVYLASKMLGERAAWDWVKENKPSFDFYAVLPGFNIGPLLDPASQKGATAHNVLELYEGGKPFIVYFDSFSWVSVLDVALLHLGALVLPSSLLNPHSSPSHRLFAAAGPFSAYALLDVFRRNEPEKRFEMELPAPKKAVGKWDTEGSERVLKALKGGEGWERLEETVRRTVEAGR
ncbi:hypothetical protein JCM8547_002014 [Rhodosporidiobolus lusitaniae]